MRLLSTDPLFAWNRLPDSPDLIALRFLLDLLPDQPLLAALRSHRGHGRNDYPLHVLWRVHLARYFLRHVTLEACLAELGRNPALRRVVGIEDGQAVPEPWNMSRFLEVLGQPQHLRLMQEMFQQLIRQLAESVPDLGRHVAGDSAALSARPGAHALEKDPNPAGLDDAGPLPQPAGGNKEYKDEAGKVTAVLEWFGYKFHLLVDVKHEVVVAWHITSASGEGTGDSSLVPLLLEKARRVLPEGRMQTLAYDKAADDQKTHDLLKEQKIKPVIQTRAMWKEEPERKLPGHDGSSNVVYDEAGTIWCYNTMSAVPVKHKMAYIGFEKQRGTLKYRCPARHEGFACPSDKKCNGCSSYGKTVRVKCELDLRRFPPIPRATQEFERRYNGRTAVERVNGRTKVYWGADDGNVSGAERFHAHLGDDPAGARGDGQLAGPATALRGQEPFADAAVAAGAETGQGFPSPGDAGDLPVVDPSAVEVTGDCRSRCRGRTCCCAPMTRGGSSRAAAPTSPGARVRIPRSARKCTQDCDVARGYIATGSN
jgi:hypothetical protein